MSSQKSLPSYVTAAQPVPKANRAPWYKNTAPTYAGIMLWFVFWHQVPMGSAFKLPEGLSFTQGDKYSQFVGGTLGQGVLVALFGMVVASLICHFLFYLVPGLLGMKTGLPLYIVGTSTYGARGGFFMPGFLMGVLQFGWLAVNAHFAGILLCQPFGYGAMTWPHAIVASVWAIVAAFLGLKGIQYVARVATFLPLIPLVILLVLFVGSFSGLKNFDPQKLNNQTTTFHAEVQSSEENETAVRQFQLADSTPPSVFGVIALLCTYIVGFFATAGAAGCDFGMNSRHTKDVQLGGLVGVAGATIFAGGLSLLIVAGAHGFEKLSDPAAMQTTSLMADIVGPKTASVFMYLLAIAAFPPACFSSFIAANSFKTTLPKVNPFISCGIGTAAAILLVVVNWAGDAAGVFQFIGASFGPVCGAMLADYLLCNRRWAGPRAGFNPAGWISWALGFFVGVFNILAKMGGMVDFENIVPIPPVFAFVVGFIAYALLAKLGLESRQLEIPATQE